MSAPTRRTPGMGTPGLAQIAATADEIEPDGTSAPDVLEVLEGAFTVHDDTPVAAVLLADRFGPTVALQWLVEVAREIAEMDLDDDGHPTINMVPPPRIAREVGACWGADSMHCVAVDVEMAPLVRWLWDRDIVTHFCCQGGVPPYRDLAYIDTNEHGARALLALAAAAEVDTRCGGLTPSGWQITREQLHGGVTDAVRVEFPPGDIPALVAAVEAQ